MHVFFCFFQGFTKLPSEWWKLFKFRTNKPLMDTFKQWCNWNVTDWLREINTAFIPFIPWQLVLYMTEADYAIKQQDLKSSTRQRSLQIYFVSDELGSLKMFLAAVLLIPLNHLPLIVETGVWDETLCQMVEGEDASKTFLFFWISLIVTDSLHFVLTLTSLFLGRSYSVSLRDRCSEHFVGQMKLKWLRRKSKGCMVSMSNLLF